MAPERSERKPSTTGEVKTGMTKVLARAYEENELSPGETAWVNVDILMTRDVSGLGSIGVFKTEFGLGENAKVLLLPTLRFVMDAEMLNFLLAKDLILQITGETSVAMGFVGSTVESMIVSNTLLLYRVFIFWRWA